MMIESDNAPTQYKNKSAFGSMQHLADKYNFTLLRVYGSAGHGKGVIDVISSFGVKNILRQSIITNVWLFENSLDIWSHITARCSQRISYTPLVLNNNKKRE